MEEWKPIETAEHIKANKSILERRILTVMRGRVTIAWWDNDQYANKPRPHWRGEDMNVGASRENQPTVWRPLPALPGN